MAVMVVATAALTRSGISSEELEQRRLASHLALRSGVEAGKALILATPEDRRVYLDGDDTAVDLGGGVSATVRLRDAAGFIDLNRSDPKLIEAVARFSGLGREAADGLADRITQLRKDAAPEPAGTPPQKAPAPAGAADAGGAAGDGADGGECAAGGVRSAAFASYPSVASQTMPMAKPRRSGNQRAIRPTMPI
jgi:hypothetical protein